MSKVTASLLGGFLFLFGCASEPNTPNNRPNGKTDNFAPDDFGFVARFLSGSFVELDVSLGKIRSDADAFRFAVYVDTVGDAGQPLEMLVGVKDVERKAASDGSLDAEHAENVILPIPFDPFELNGPLAGEAPAFKDLTVRVEMRQRCGDADAYCSEAISYRRPLAAWVRPFPKGEIQKGNVHTAEVDEDVTEKLYFMSKYCRNPLITVGGTKRENHPRPNGVKYFMDGQDYDCVIGVAYDDARSTNTGGVLSRNTRRFCESTKLGVASFSSVVYLLNEYERDFSVFAHSKGAAVVLQSRKQYPDVIGTKAPIYAVGLPQALAAEELNDYRVGEIFTEDNVTAFTWENDRVAEYSACSDLLAALELNGHQEAHNYDYFFAKDYQVDDSDYDSRMENREAFYAGEEKEVGRAYHYQQ